MECRQENDKRKKNIIIKILLVMVMLITVLFIGSYIAYYFSEERIKLIEYTEDYPEKYAKELGIIFGPTMQIGEKEIIEVEGEHCDCGYHIDSYTYYEWTITYEGIDGQLYKVVMDNKSNLGELQIEWIKEHLSQYMKRTYMINHFEEGMIEGLSVEEYYGSSYCFISLGSDISSFTSDMMEEYNRVQELGENYYFNLIDNLQEEKNMIPLYQISLEQICNDFPLIFSIHLSINDAELQGKEKEIFEKDVQEKLIEMIDRINKDSKDKINLYVQICSATGANDLYDGARDWRYYYIQGERMVPEDHYDYDFEVFYSYEGIYW